MTLATTQPTSSVVGGVAYDAQWQSKNSIKDTKVMSRLYKNVGQGYRIVDFLNLSGQVLSIPSGGCTHIEQDAPLAAIKTGSVISTGVAGDQISFTLHADNLDANSNHALREDFDLVIPSAYQPSGVKDERKYHVTDITGTTVTAEPWSADGNTRTASQIDTEIPSGTWLAIGPSAYIRGAGQPTGTTDDYSTRSHKTRIMKETIEIEGGQMAEMYYPATGMARPKGLKLVASARAEFLLENQWEQYIRDGEEEDNSALTATSNFGGTNDILSGNGILTWAQLLSSKHYYNTSMGMDDFYDIKLLQENQSVVATLNDFFVGPSIGVDLEKAGLDWLQQYSGGTDLYDKMEKIVGISIKKINLGGKVYAIHVLDSFKNPAQAGLNIDGSYTYSYPELGLMIPREMATVTMNMGGAQSTKTIPNVNLGAVNHNGENRQKMYGVLLGMNGFEPGQQVASEYDGNKYYWASEISCICAECAKWILVRKSK